MNPISEKDYIQDSDYSKYLEEMKMYYNLKNKYTSNKNTIINKLINSKDSLETKQKLYSKQIFKCINCAKPGGTIFVETNKMLRATCGNTNQPCNLNIEIIKLSSILVNKELEQTHLTLFNKKREIVLTKLDYLFNYIDEESAVEKFETLKQELSNMQDVFSNLFILHESI